MSIADVAECFWQLRQCCVFGRMRAAGYAQDLRSCAEAFYGSRALHCAAHETEVRTLLARVIESYRMEELAPFEDVIDQTVETSMLARELFKLSGKILGVAWGPLVKTFRPLWCRYNPMYPEIGRFVYVASGAGQLEVISWSCSDNAHVRTPFSGGKDGDDGFYMVLAEAVPESETYDRTVKMLQQSSNTH